MASRPRIVIAGAGFGGLYTLRFLARALKPEEADLIIIDQKNYFLFTPLLHEVATCSLGETESTEEIGTLIKRSRAELVVAKIKEIDLAAREARLDGGRIIPYDYLVLALGSSAADKGIKGAREHGFFLKSLPDAIKLRRHLAEILAAAAGEKKAAARQELLCLVIVGGGPTGVELAGEMVELVRDARRKYYPGIFEDREFNFILAQSGPELLPAFHPRLRAWARRSLLARGWKILTEKAVDSVEADAVVLGDGTRLKSRTVILSAGVSPNTSVLLNHSLALRRGRVLTDKHLRLLDHPNVFALGDNATTAEAADEWPMLAQAAAQAAEVVARNLACAIRQKPLLTFRYRSAGALISLGRWRAIGEIKGVPVRGAWVWLLWQLVYLFKFISWPKRFKIAASWLSHVWRTRDLTIRV